MNAYDLFQAALSAANYLVVIAILAVGLGGAFVFLYQLRIDQRRRESRAGSDFASVLDE